MLAPSLISFVNQDPERISTTAAPEPPEDLSAVVARFDASILAFLRSRALPANLHDALVYSVLGGGKRLRPALAWYSSIACGGTGEDTISAGIGVELVHAFSLIHDDLPALDDDDLRRGRPTLHRHAGESMAILAGDALLALGYEAVLEHPEVSIAHRLSTELARGTRAMITGQVFDTLGGMPAGIGEAEAVELIHRNKTGALLRASCRMGAICAGADDQLVELVCVYADAIGLQFQIIDDLLDVEGSSETVGKAIGKDEAAGKRTYPSVLGAERSRVLVDELGQAANEALEALGSATDGDIQPLRRMGHLLTHRRD